MLEDLRNSADFSEEPEPQPKSQKPAAGPRPAPRQLTRLQEKLILGMTASQRFIVSLLLLFSTCLLGTLFLIVTGRIYIP